MTSGSVVVVGGGLAGIAAAIRAADDGASVRLFELSPRLGGATWSFTRDGLTYDNGQHVFMRCCTDYRELLDRIGSGGDVVLQDRMDVVVRDEHGRVGRLHRTALPAPLHLSSSLLRYPHLSLGDRARAARVALSLRALRLDDRALDGITFGSWLEAHGASTESIEALWDLVCVPTVNLPARHTSLLLAAKVFKTGLLDHAGGADIGWSRVPLQELHGDAAARAMDRLGVEVRTSARVHQVGSDPEVGPWVAVDGVRLHADAVVVAVPHDAVARIVPVDTFGQQVRPDALGRSAIVNVHLLYDRPVMEEPSFAALRSPVQFVFDRTTASGAPRGQQMLAVSLSAGEEHLAKSRAELVDEMSGALARLLPAAREARVVTSMITRDPQATFAGRPGTAAHRPGPVTNAPGVFVAGAWTDTGWPATMEGAVRSGNAAAAEVRRHLARSTGTRGAAA
jgi:squalene-associated FAD-dependent desaturase